MSRRAHRRGVTSEADMMNTLFSDVEWVGNTKSAGGRGSNKDVTISSGKGNTRIIFRNRLAHEIGDRVSVAVKGNTLLFKSTEDGYKISLNNNRANKKSPSSDNGYVKIQKSVIDLSSFDGHYDITYFEPLDIWYVQKGESNG